MLVVPSKNIGEEHSIIIIAGPKNNIVVVQALITLILLVFNVQRRTVKVPFNPIYYIYAYFTRIMYSKKTSEVYLITYKEGNR